MEKRRETDGVWKDEERKKGKKMGGGNLIKAARGRDKFPK